MALLLVASAGCSFAPHYTRPSSALPQTWKTAEGWQQAQPADQAPRPDWWGQFAADPQLDALMTQADAHNQTVAQAEATWRQARATVKAARATLFPTVTANGRVTHNYNGGGGSVVTGGTVTSSNGSRTSDNYQVNLGASWEPDLFGSIRNTVSTEKATEQARLADLGSAQLALHGELATNYLSLRATDAQLVVLATTVAAYQRSLQIATNRYNAAIAARTDVYQAQSQLESAQSDYEGLKQTRAQYEDAIAVLVGEPAASFRIEPLPTWTPVIPTIPAVLPSTLIQRRPDVASTERLVAAGNAQIGVAKAAFFPTLALSGSYGFNNGSISGLFASAATLWSLGATVAETLIDFGARKAQLEGARAAYDATVATYRGTVLTALQEVQDALVAQDILARQEAHLRAASVAADKSEASIRDQYRAGIVVYTDVVTAQATALSARRALVQAQLDRQTAAVTLVQALGGGWDEAILAQPVADHVSFP